jgi:hypothetical protein
MKRGLPKELYRANETELTITLANAVVIWFKSGEKPDNLYGDDVYAAVIDEASRTREEAWYAVRSTLTATRGPCRLIGNVKGAKNWFFKLSRMAEAGAIGMSYAKLTAHDAVKGGVLAQSEIDDAQRLLPESVFRELYMAEPSDDESNPFGLAHIRQCVIPEASEERTIVAGVDLAKRRDWTVVIGLDAHAQMTGIDRWQLDWEATEKRILGIVGNVPTLADSTGVGDPIVERLQKKRRRIEGFVFTAKSKQQLMEGLAVGLQNHEIGILDGAVRAELETIEYQYTRTGVRYAAPAGYHDDCVMSLALAYRHYMTHGARHATKPHSAPRVSPWFGVGTPAEDE